MTDFSKREEVRRWLASIEPAERRRQVAVAFAARAALRVLPVLVGELRSTRRKRAETLSALILPVFRAAASPWVAARYPSHGNALRAAAHAAANAAAAAAEYAYAEAAYAAAAVNAAAYAAANANAAANADPDYAAAASNAATTAAANAAANANAAADADADADAALIDAGCSATELVARPLWPNDAAPEWSATAWRELSAALLAADNDWDVWTGWYEARLFGDTRHPPIEALEIARATIAEKIWKQGPAVVNAAIRRLIDEHESLRQRPAVDDPASDPASINDPSQAEADQARVAAVRAVLRVLPLLATDDRSPDEAKSQFALSVFRALAVAWARILYSAVGTQGLAIEGAREALAHSPTDITARHLVGRAAKEVTLASGISAAAAIGRASVARIRTKSALNLASPPDNSQQALDEAIELDRKDAGSRLLPSQIAQIELWTNRAPPRFLGDQWKKLSEELRSANEGWDVWIDWYESRLEGRVRTEEVELAYVRFAQNIAQTASTREANSEIRRLIDEASGPIEGPPPLWDFFVSYATANETAAREVVSVLEAAGHSTIAQFKDFVVGANFVHEMNRGLAGAGRVVALYSQDYQDSAHCQAEWAAAYNADPSGARRKLVPLLLAPTALSPLARQVVYKRLIGLTEAQRRTAILEAIAPAPPPKSPQEIKALLAEVASPQASINVRGQLDAGPNVPFDRPFVDEDLPELPHRQRSLASLIRRSLPGNAPRVVGYSLDAYFDHLTERGAQPIVRFLDDYAAALRAEYDAPDVADWGPGLKVLFERFFANDSLLRTHFPLKGEELFADHPIDEDEATGPALAEPMKKVATAMQQVRSADKATDAIAKAVSNSVAFANDLASLPPSQSPPDPNSRRVTVKRRYVLGTIGFLVTIYNLIGTTASIYGLPAGEALFKAVGEAIETLMSLLL